MSTQTQYSVIRGGSWLIVDPSWVRASYRIWNTRSNRSGNVGLRCATRV